MNGNWPTNMSRRRTAWGVRRGAYGVGRTAWGVRRGAYGVGRTAWGLQVARRWPQTACPAGDPTPVGPHKAVSGVARPQGVEGLGMACPSDTLGVYSHPLPNASAEEHEPLTKKGLRRASDTKAGVCNSRSEPIADPLQWPC
jgi:hypothetical protein